SDLDTYSLTVLQLATCSVITFLASLKSGFHIPPDAGVWKAIIYTALFATSLAFIVQTWAQSFIPPSSVGVILAMEVVFAAIFGIWILNESLTLRIASGGAMVLVAMYAILFLDQSPSSVTGSSND
ncbi:MAG: DMT family transporter, partial [Actinomycetes bacterium]